MGYLIVIIGYLVLLMGMGVVMSKKEVKTSDDFVVAGRRLPTIILVGTLLATWCGAGGVTGSPNFVYTYGPYAGILHFMGPPVGIIALYFIAARIRKHAKYTIPELLETKYGVPARTISAICILLAYVGIVSTQFRAAGNLLGLITGIDSKIATLIAAVAIVFLAASGGMITVAYSDAVSALLMVGGFLLAVPFLLSGLGMSFGDVMANLPAGKNTMTGNLTFLQILGYILPHLILILGDQNLFQRFSSARDEETAKKSTLGLLGGELTVIILTLAITTIGIIVYPTLANPDNVIFQLALDRLPFIVGALLLAATVSFIITTADSYLLSSATNLTYDIWAKFIKKDATDEEKLKFIRVVIIVFGVLAYAMCMFFPSILTIQMYSYTMYGASITPALMCAFFWKKVTPAGGTCGILAGGISTLLWEIVLKSPGGIKSAVVAVPVSLIVIFVVSMMTQKSIKSNVSVR